MTRFLVVDRGSDRITRPPGANEIVMNARATAYLHTQRGRFHYLLWLGGLAGVVGAFFVMEPLLALVLGLVGFLMIGLGFLFAELTIRDEGSELRLRYGPVPLVGRSVPYDEVLDVRRGRSRWIDGFGIHWVPGRGWTWNLWGFDCVELELEGGRRLRIGSDDADRLAEVLRERVERSGAEQG